MLHPDSTKRSFQQKAAPLSLFATFNPQNPSPESQKTQRISKEMMQPIADNQNITESLTFIQPITGNNSQQQLTTLKNMNKNCKQIEYNSLNIKLTSSSIMKNQQVRVNHTKLKEDQPQLMQIISSLKLNESQLNRSLPYKKIKKDSSVKIEFHEQVVRFEDSEIIVDDHQQLCRKNILTFNHTVSVVFIPNETLKKGPFLSQKLGKKSNEIDDYSILSHQSSFTQKSDSEQVQIPFPKSNLIRLNQISLLLLKSQKKKNRIDEQRHAHEKMHHLYSLNKQKLELIKKQMQKIKKFCIILQQKLEKEKELRISMIAEKEKNQETIRLLKELNQGCLKDNNDIKQKLNTYLKIIHELKLQLSQKQQKQRQNYLRGSQSTINMNLYSKIPQNDQFNEILYPTTSKNVRSDIDISQKIQKKKSNLNGSNKVIVQEKGRKINNSYSIPHFQNIKNQKKQEGGQQGFQNIYSHRNITLTPNFFTQMIDEDEQEPKFGSRGGKINTIPQRRQTLKIGQQKQVDRSLSGFSNVSGISAIQKIGYLVKPRKDNNFGELVDYLETQNVDYERTFRARNKTEWNIDKNQ